MSSARGRRERRAARVRRRKIWLLVPGVVVGLGAAGFLVAGQIGDRSKPTTSARIPVAASTPLTTAGTTTGRARTTTTVPSTVKSLQLLRSVTGDISPKSVVASGTGLVFAQNMMYSHTVTVYDRDGTLVSTIPDSVDLATFGIGGHPGTVQGAPVEVAFTPNGAKAYVSNYSMYGAGFGPEGTDECSPASGFSDSFVYRIDTKQFVIDQVIPVGEVPKFVAVTPDGALLLVANWCSYDLTVVDVHTGTTVATLPIGTYPRGIVVDPRSKTAYVAVMGANEIAVVDLEGLTVSGFIQGVGSAPRHLVISPDGKFLYVTLNGDGQVAKVDLASSQVVARVLTGSRPRSMAESVDGLSLYVVNYDSSTVSKLATDDLRILQTVTTPDHPIGITVDPKTGRVWVACYSGSILVYDDA